MKIDIEEIFSSGFLLVVKQVFLFFLAVWAGCMISGMAWMAGEMVEDSTWTPPVEVLWWSPVLLLTAWLLPNLVFLGIQFCRLVVYSENTSIRTWAALIGGEALFTMLAVHRTLKGDPAAQGTAWGVWVVVVAMVGTGLWFLHQWQTNRWARQLAELKAENSMRRAVLKDEMGIESAGVDETGIP